MTLLLRRKHPTTVPNSTKEKAGTNAWGRLLALPSLASFCILHSAFCLAAANGQEPQTFTPDIDARPISATEAASSGVLRWQSKPAVNVSEYVASDAAAQPIHGNTPQPARGAGWNITRIDPSVRPAQYTASDPFNDPFGDHRTAGGGRNANSREPELILQPTQAEAGVEELPAPRRFSPVRRAVPDEPAMTVARQPGGAARGTLPGGTPAMPPMGAPPVEKSSVPCDRIYNDRNCCELETNCHAFRDRLLSDSIRNISLDITAPFDKDPEISPEENEAARMDRLRLLEVRQWRDRRGNVIATGKMANLQNGSVVISDESGKETARLPINELGEDSLCYITAWWRLPAECPLGGLRNAERNWLASNFHYHASALCHKPLYFQEVQLERYGHTAGPVRQPIISGAHFIMNLALLPYHMGINPPTECQYPLGYYRPGNCAPWMIQPFPLSARGAAAEIGAALGMAALIP
jgi:hypothetical protein